MLNGNFHRRTGEKSLARRRIEGKSHILDCANLVLFGPAFFEPPGDSLIADLE
jgi:hypothetical protein